LKNAQRVASITSAPTTRLVTAGCKYRRHKREVEDDGAVRTVPRHGGKNLTCPLLYAQLGGVYQKTLIFPSFIFKAPLETVASGRQPGAQ
jgi:hypothetical protein